MISGVIRRLMMFTACCAIALPLGCFSSDNRRVTLETGNRFAQALTEKRYPDAHALLTVKQQKIWSPDKLARQYEEMTSYGSGPAKVDGHSEFLDSWPDRQPEDRGWAYISISGLNFAEAETVIVSDEAGIPKIRHLEWGRP